MIKVGEEIEIVGLHAESRQRPSCTGVEMFNKTLDHRDGPVTMSACLLRGVKREDIERGQVLAKPGSITPHTKFEAEVYCPRRRTKGADTRRSSAAIARSSTFERRT